MVNPPMSDAQTRDRLVADLTDASARVRQRAALALSTMPDVTIEDALVNAAVRERDAFVRDTLTHALAEERGLEGGEHQPA